MTTEQLMIPRVKVKMDYPSSQFEVGDILYRDYATSWIYKVTEVVYTQDETFLNAIPETDITKYPHIFQPMQWWEDREIGDLPMYLKDNKCGCIVIKVHEYSKEDNGRFVSEANAGCGFLSNIIYWLPATEAEYLEYLKSKK